MVDVDAIAQAIRDCAVLTEQCADVPSGEPCSDVLVSVWPRDAAKAIAELLNRGA